MNQNAAVSIGGTRQRLAKEILCIMEVHSSSESIFSSTSQVSSASREHRHHERDLLFELCSLSAGVFQPMGHQAQKQEPGAKHNVSQSWQLKMLRDALVWSPERQKEARPGCPVPRRSQGKDQGAAVGGLGEG